MLNSERINEVLDYVQRGSRQVIITFKKEAEIADVCVLLAFRREEGIKVSTSNLATLLVVIRRRSWIHDTFRTITVSVNDALNRAAFVKFAQRALENIEHVGPKVKFVD